MTGTYRQKLSPPASWTVAASSHHLIAGIYMWQHGSLFKLPMTNSLLHALKSIEFSQSFT